MNRIYNRGTEDVTLIKRKQMESILEKRDKYLVVLQHEYNIVKGLQLDDKMFEIRSLINKLKRLEYTFDFRDYYDPMQIRYTEPSCLSGFKDEDYDRIVKFSNVN